MYKIIKEHPASELIAEFGMKISQEDTFTDYRIVLNTLSAEKKKRLCALYGIDPQAIEGKEIVRLSIPAEV